MRSVLPLGNRSFFSPTFLSEVFGLNEDLSCDKDVVSSGGSFLFCRECNVSADLSPSLFAVPSTGLLTVAVNAFRFSVPLKKKELPMQLPSLPIQASKRMLSFSVFERLLDPPLVSLFAYDNTPL